MTFKKLLIIMSVAIIFIIMMLFSTSYAWYQFDNAYTSFSNVQTYSDDIDLAVVFTNSDNINAIVGVPITSDQVEEYSEKTIFTLTPSSAALSGRNVAYQISLENLKIDSALTSVDSLKYALLETVNGTTSTVASGSFSGVTSSSLILKNMTTITTFDVTYSYEFRLWLEENNENQNALMGKSLSGKIKVSTAIK